MEHNLSDYPVIKKIELAWGEMDAFRHINNIYFLRYFESVRMAYFEELRERPPAGEDQHLGPILGHISCKYISPLTFPDMISVGAKVDSISADRLSMSYLIVSEKNQKVAAKGDSIIVAYDYKALKKAALPPAWRNFIEKKEGRSF